MASDRKKTINVLLGEDNPGDVFIITSVLKESQVSYNLHHVIDGQEVLMFLSQQQDYANAPRPDLILLDLNLPIKDGFEVLEKIKSSPELKMIPVIICTSSSAEQDILRSYDLFASCCMTKPVDLIDFQNAVKSLEKFWLQYVQFPSQLQPQ